MAPSWRQGAHCRDRFRGLSQSARSRRRVGPAHRAGAQSRLTGQRRSKQWGGAGRPPDRGVCAAALQTNSKLQWGRALLPAGLAAGCAVSYPSSCGIGRAAGGEPQAPSGLRLPLRPCRLTRSECETDAASCGCWARVSFCSPSLTRCCDLAGLRRFGRGHQPVVVVCGALRYRAIVQEKRVC